jgi:choline dehydrogenase-like flavoprotein
MDSYDVCVIGAGYGGATVAALLAHAGRRVARG